MRKKNRKILSPFLLFLTNLRKQSKVSEDNRYPL